MSVRIHPLRARRIARWVAENATPVEIADVEQAARADVEALAWLDALVAGKRFAFVGEANHFVHEKLGYRLFMVRYLASRGFTVLLEELAWSDGLRIDRYLQTGDEAWLERVGTFGFSGDARLDRDDRWTGYLAPSLEHYPTAAFKHEHLRLIRALREVRPRLANHGFDVDYQPGAGYAHLGELDVELRALAAPVAGESIEAEIARLERLVHALEARPASGAQLRTARSLRDGFRYTALIKDAPTLEALRSGMAFRESVMHEQVDDVVASYPPDTRFIVFAHDLHLARDDARVAPGAGVGPGGGRVDAIGTHIAKRHPGEVFAVWMLDCEGQDSQPLVALGNRVRAPRGSLNAALARAGESYFVPVRGPLADRHRVAFMYGSTADVDLDAQVDALFFSRRVSPLRER
jgi:erythromycin esterase-like protein